MTEVMIRSARKEDVASLRENLRDGDAAEIRNAGLTPAVIWRLYRRSGYARTAMVDGDVAAMWGLDGIGLLGHPWLLTAPPVERVKMSFLRVMRQEVQRMLAMCPTLTGMVDAEYRGAVRLLEIVGFDLSEPFPHGPYGMPFRRFTLERRHGT